MSNNTTTPDTTAASWVTRLYSGEMTDKEEQALKRWRQQPANEEAFQATLATWDLSAALYTQDRSRVRAKEAHADKVQDKQKTWWALAAVAASAAFIGITLFVGEVQPPDSPQNITTAETRPIAAMDATKHEIAAGQFRITEQKAQTRFEQTRRFATEIGEVSHIKLDDGSLVSLNTDSAIEVTMRSSERQIELLHGEVFFDVAKDPQRPFVVLSDEQQITVLGTEFNVRKRSDEKAIKIAVVEGRVAVKSRISKPASQTDTNTTPTSSQQQLLLAGDIGAFSGHSKVIQQNKHTEVQVSNTWRRGVVRFDNEKLSIVVSELNRYRIRKINFAKDDVRELRISGVFHLQNGDAIIDALAATLPITIEQEPDQVRIAPQ